MRIFVHKKFLLFQYFNSFSYHNWKARNDLGIPQWVNSTFWFMFIPQNTTQWSKGMNSWYTKQPGSISQNFCLVKRNLTPKSYIPYDSIHKAFLKWQNYRNRQRLGWFLVVKDGVRAEGKIIVSIKGQCKRPLWW